jgi:hypothetical protein
VSATRSRSISSSVFWTTCSLVVRHESSSAYTLLIVGHSHTVEHPSTKEALFGNGGAPLSGYSVNYGYDLFAQRQDGAIVVDSMDYQTNKADRAFHFVVKADGSLTQ